MDFVQRLEAIRRDMKAQAIDLLIGVHDGTHFSGTSNPLLIMSGFRSISEAAVLLHHEDESVLVVTPAWDAERAAEYAPGVRVQAADDLALGLAQALSRYRVAPSRIAVAGHADMPRTTAFRINSLFDGKAREADSMILAHAKSKTSEEIERARVATRIAEQGYERMLEIAKPGMREDELAVELRWMMKTLGAEDNFFMLNSGPHNRSVQPCGSRRFERGDLILTELSPVYLGQMTQICRTIVVGHASEAQRQCYAFLVRAFQAGAQAAKPGAPMAEVCNAVDAVLEAEGYGEYCRPPYLRLRRRGHGLGFSSILPGDVGPENTLPLEAGMVFVLHPNQYLPQTGYMMCGEPVLITEKGCEPLTQRRSALAEISA